LLAGTLLPSFCVALTRTRQLITKCWQDIERLDTGGGYDPHVAPGENGMSVSLSADNGKLLVRHGARTIGAFSLADLSSNAEVLWSPDGTAFALNYSDGGAIGGFRVKLYLLRAGKVTDASDALKGAQENFKSRHFCKDRGNNLIALKWLPDSSDLVLMTQVYPTGDCGPDLGHSEAYIVRIPEGKILRHLTLSQLQHLPGICLQNEEQ